jgi:hypothetical protein
MKKSRPQFVDDSCRCGFYHRIKKRRLAHSGSIPLSLGHQTCLTADFRIGISCPELLSELFASLWRRCNFCIVPISSSRPLCANAMKIEITVRFFKQKLVRTHLIEIRYAQTCVDDIASQTPIKTTLKLHWSAQSVDRRYSGEISFPSCSLPDYSIILHKYLFFFVLCAIIRPLKQNPAQSNCSTAAGTACRSSGKQHAYRRAVNNLKRCDRLV